MPEGGVPKRMTAKQKSRDWVDKRVSEWMTAFKVWTSGTSTAMPKWSGPPEAFVREVFTGLRELEDTEGHYSTVGVGVAILSGGAILLPVTTWLGAGLPVTRFPDADFMSFSVWCVLTIAYAVTASLLLKVMHDKMLPVLTALGVFPAGAVVLVGYARSLMHSGSHAGLVQWVASGAAAGAVTIVVLMVAFYVANALRRVQMRRTVARCPEAWVFMALTDVLGAVLDHEVSSMDGTLAYKAQTIEALEHTASLIEESLASEFAVHERRSVLGMRDHAMRMAAWLRGWKRQLILGGNARDTEFRSAIVQCIEVAALCEWHRFPTAELNPVPKRNFWERPMGLVVRSVLFGGTPVVVFYVAQALRFKFGGLNTGAVELIVWAWLLLGPLYVLDPFAAAKLAVAKDLAGLLGRGGKEKGTGRE